MIRRLLTFLIATSHTLPGFLLLCSLTLSPPAYAQTATTPPMDDPADAFPKTLPGWKVELLLKSPELKHPSVVCTAQDGRVFVAEDPMDISTDRADAQEGRILCLHPDGRVTVFAEKLYAVFGMKHIEGRLYVLHNPKFTVFMDHDGVGKDSLDLIESTNPEPWAKDWNDHVPANFELGMDGFLYIAVGDKGLFGAVGRDGKRVDLHGGGIVRIRPDGTELEIYATGLRNILDVAMNDEDELFTYDNTDEKQWMSRLTHIVEGGTYGYPWDFHPRQPHVLWCMADYGAGAATGAFADTEGALPAPFSGNLFLADFGKRQVLSVGISRRGATFQTNETREIFPDPPGNFRPVGIRPTHDGTGFYLCDWQHRDSKNKVTVGRLFRITHENAKPSQLPAWHVQASNGFETSVALEDLVLALEHPSRSVRLNAQRRIAERGSGAVSALTDLLENPTKPGIARAHAIWALDAIDGGEVSRGLIRAAIYSVDPIVRRQALRQLGFRMARGAVPELQGRLEDEDLAARLHAATALGRIADPAAIPALFEALFSSSSEEWMRFACFTALNRIGQWVPAAWPRIARRLERPSAAERSLVSLALRNTWDISLAASLEVIGSNPDLMAGARFEAIKLLAAMHQKFPEWKGEWWAYHPVNMPRPERTEDWSLTPSIGRTLATFAADPDASISSLAWELIAAERVTEAAPELRNIHDRERDPERRRQLISTLGSLRDTNSVPLILTSLRGQKLPEPDVLTALRAAEAVGFPSNQVTRELSLGIARYLDQEAPSPALAQRSIQALGTLRDAEGQGAIRRRLGDTNIQVHVAALKAWPQVQGDAAALIPSLDVPVIAVQQAAIQALAVLKAQDQVPKLLSMQGKPELKDDAFRALAAIGDVRALDAYLAELTNRSFTVREQAQKAIHSIRDAALPLLESRKDRLPSESIAALKPLYLDHSPGKQSPLFASMPESDPVEAYARFATSNPGDAAKGRKHFMNLGAAACIKCHKVGSEGTDVGPDLTQVGSQFDRKALVESVLWPSKVVREGYQQTLIELHSDESLSGLIKGETADSITVRDPDGRTRTVLKSDIANRRTSELSMMPEGLHASLTREEFADLIAYLESLKKKP
ncbi:MAG: c-type cytochrome [Verrucomicrobia bacterium]|nr:c-type cytochrome [Verrucomicrobiota bacterium]